MFKPLIATLGSLALAASASAQEMDLVTDKNACHLEPFDRQELAMTFNGDGMSEIEYYCELSESMPYPVYSGDWTFVTNGYCEEPGALYPYVFVFRTFRGDEGKVYAYWGDQGEGVVFHDCRW